MVKSISTKRFAVYGFPLKVDCTLEMFESNSKRDISTFMFSSHSLTLKEWSKVQTSGTNNKQDIGIFMLSCHNVTLKERSKVKSDTIKRFAAHFFPEGDCTLQTSKTNNRRDRTLLLHT